jgi:hypothetical protein
MTVWNRIMNGIKNLALILVVVGVGYLVYQHLYGPGKTTGPATPQGPEPPTLEIPGLNRPGQSKTVSPAGSGVSAGTPLAVQPTSQFLPAGRPPSGAALPDPDQKKSAPESSSSNLPARPEPKPSGGASGTGNLAPPSAPIARSDSTPRDTSVKTIAPDSDKGHPSGKPTDSSAQQEAATVKPEGAGANQTATRPADNEIREQFIKCMQVAHQLLQQGSWTNVLAQLSPWYRDANLTKAESEKLTELLDRLAGSVIYSRDHRLEPPYRVRPGDNLVQIARQYQVTWELLAKINGIPDPYRLDGVEVLKVLRGPFHALVDLTHRDITLMLEFRDPQGNISPLYAGRFPIRAISGVSELEGQYEVLRKAPGPRLQQPGPLALELSQQVIIHGPADPQSLPKSRATIELPETDMEDIYDILTVGSRVLIRK